MTKEEYKNTVCKHCINNNNCKNEISSYKDEFGIVKYRCRNYVSIFLCNQRSCKNCGRCG